MSKQQIFYGVHACLDFIQNSPDLILTIFLQHGKDADTKFDEVIIYAKKHKLTVEYVDKANLDTLSNQGVHQGICLACKTLTTYSENDLEVLLGEAKASPFILILDNIQDPHNLGACIRTADASGVDFIIISKNKSAPVNATVQKVACGAANRVKVIIATNLARTIKILKQSGVWIYGFADESSELLYTQDFTGSVALVMGSEGNGLRKLTRQLCDHLVYIPMFGSVSSLNVSVAAGVGLYEVVRQRRAL